MIPWQRMCKTSKYVSRQLDHTALGCEVVTGVSMPRRIALVPLLVFFTNKPTSLDKRYTARANAFRYIHLSVSFIVLVSVVIN